MIYNEELPYEGQGHLTELRSPRVCLLMPRFYPLFGGHIVQMMQFLPRLQKEGIPVFVVTGMVEGYPQTKGLRDLLHSLREDKERNGRIAQFTQLIRSFFQGWQHTWRHLRQHPDCFRQPALTERGVDIYRLPTWGPIHTIRSRTFGLAAAWFLIRNRHQYDIIHLVGTAWHMPASILLSRLLGKKVVVEMVLMGSDDPETIGRRFGKILLAIWKRADRIVSLSPALTESCQRANVPTEKMALIPVGVDMQRFAPLRDETVVKQLREKLNLPLQSKLVVFVGSIMQRKGVDLLIDAWNLVIEKVPDAHLVCLGPIGFSADSITFYEQQTQKIAAYGLAETITFKGRVDNVDEYFQAADLFVLPSVTEGLPNSVLEAMACELPPVMSDIPGISRTIIRSAAEGIVFPERTDKALAEALLRLIQDDNLRATVGQQARRRILEAYSLTYRTEQYKTLYHTLLNGSEPV